MKEILLALARGEDLSQDTAEQAMHLVMGGAATAAQTAAYLTLLRQKGETVDELTGSVRAMREHATGAETGVDGPIVDTCGTGGDGAGTFNISTASAFVAAAAGLKVAKHGNRAASSRAGSADVLGSLGVAIDLAPTAAAKSLDETGFCFLFAQAYHPAMKYVAPIRRELGFRTMFNILGPLTNPARPGRQVLGTPDRETASKIAQVLARLGIEHALVLHSSDGLDEISTAAPTHVFEVRGAQIAEFSIEPGVFGLPRHDIAGIRGGEAEENAAIIRAIFDGATGAPRDVVVMNAAAALYVGGAAASLREGARLAESLIDQGLVRAKLAQVVAFGADGADGVGVQDGRPGGAGRAGDLTDGAAG